MKISLIGFMGTGKSALGQLLAKELHYDFIDTDQLIEARERRQITEIFQSDGEAYFRALEHGLARELHRAERLVIATGGGFPLNPENLRLLRENGLVIALTATPETIYRRVIKETHRPLLTTGDPLAQIRALMKARDGIYRNSDLTVDTNDRSLPALTEEIMTELHKRGYWDGKN
ncbi:MAG TPA: shikimate kinase [Bacillota bacterium]